MKKYVEPKTEIIFLDDVDIVTTSSGGLKDGGTPPFGDKEVDDDTPGYDW